MQNKMKLDAEIFDADLNENRCKFARQPHFGGNFMQDMSSGFNSPKTASCGVRSILVLE